MEPSDDDLVGRAARGDDVAFTMLVVRHKDRLVALARRFVGAAEAEDVVQEAFVRAWTLAARWRNATRLSTAYRNWLVRVTTNLAIDRYRRTRRTVACELTEAEDHAPPQDVALSDRERDEKLRAAVEKLPERQRLALSLTYDAELSNVEGAQAMSISVGAFELLLVRARRALRNAFQEDEQ